MGGFDFTDNMEKSERVRILSVNARFILELEKSEYVYLITGMSSIKISSGARLATEARTHSVILRTLG